MPKGNLVAYLNKAKELDIHNEPIKQLVLGRDLIELGFKPSSKFKEILEFAFDLQIDENMNKEEIIKKIIEIY
jgi:tRNA nucleotidyltransferase (CCA-adding enzyme)